MDYTQQANGSTEPSSPAELLAEYEAAGIKSVRLHHETKKPIDRGWPEKRLPRQKIIEYVGCGGNVG